MLSTYDGITTPGDWLCKECGHRRSNHDTRHEFVRDERDFVGMLRIKNEEKYIAEVIEAALPLCSRLFVFNDHSSDRTAEICQRYSEITFFDSPFTGMNEARDKTWIYDQVMAACAPQWILCIDGDEVLEKRGAEIIRRHTEDEPCHAYSLKIVFLWNDRGTARVDRIYGDFWRPSLFAPFHIDPETPDHLKVARELRFMSTPFGRRLPDQEPNLHCSSVPQRFLHGHKRLPARLKHYGYLERSQRVRKLDFYNGIDWCNAAEDSYRHMVQGDGVTIDELPTVQGLLRQRRLSPADVQHILDAAPDKYLLHAGPLRLEVFTE